MTGHRLRGLPKMARETVPVSHRKCGKTNCHCAASGEELHESTVLSYKQGGKTKHLMLPAAEVEPLRMATERFRAAKSRVEAKGNAG